MIPKQPFPLPTSMVPGLALPDATARKQALCGAAESVFAQLLWINYRALLEYEVGQDPEVLDKDIAGRAMRRAQAMTRAALDVYLEHVDDVPAIVKRYVETLLKQPGIVL